MSTLPEVRGAEPGASPLGDVNVLTASERTAGLLVPARAPLLQRLRDRLAALDVAWQYPLAIYLLSRVVYLVIAVADTFIRHQTSMLTTLYAWDGHWYAAIAVNGYPNHVIDAPGEWSTLGFFPLYSILMWATGEVTRLPYFYAGLIVSLTTGASATLLVARLAQRWWDNARITRRAILFFCLFPGSVVFSMDYTEGLLITLIAGCMLAMAQRRWLLAGLLAGLSTAVGPVALSIVPACALASALELRRAGWFQRGGPGWSERRRALRSLAAPLLAPTGILAFGAYLWIRTGTPFASYLAQRNAWGEHSSPLALYFDAKLLIEQIAAFHSFHHPAINLNLISGLLGAGFLVWGLRHVWRARRVLPAPALAWTAGLTLLTLTSEQVPPNPRMLLCAFPVLLAIAAQIQRTAYVRLLQVTGFLMVGMSLLTFVGNSLRP